jgi:membrane protease subunit HflC
MRSNLQQKAAQIRAQGEASRREIIADADKQVTITLAKASQQSFTERGAGEAQSAALFAASYGKDPGFAAFYRSMEAYEGSFADDQTTLVLSPDSDFFKYFRLGPKAK